MLALFVLTKGKVLIKIHSRFCFVITVQLDFEIMQEHSRKRSMYKD